MTPGEWDDLRKKAERIAAYKFANAIQRYGTVQVNAADIAARAIMKLWLRHTLDPTFDPKAKVALYVNWAGLDVISEVRDRPIQVPLLPDVDIPAESPADGRGLDLAALEATIDAYKDQATRKAGAHEDRVAFRGLVGEVAWEVLRRCREVPNYSIFFAHDPRLEVWGAMCAVIPEFGECSPTVIPSDSNRRRIYRVIAEVLRLFGRSQE